MLCLVSSLLDSGRKKSLIIAGFFFFVSALGPTIPNSSSSSTVNTAATNARYRTCVTPSCHDGPCVGCGKHIVDVFGSLLDDGVGVLAKNHEVDEVNHKLTEDDCKLVPRHERTADV